MTLQEAQQIFSGIDTADSGNLQKEYKRMVEEAELSINEYAQDETQKNIYLQRLADIHAAYKLLANNYRKLAADGKVETPGNETEKQPEVKSHEPAAPRPPSANMLKKPAVWLLLFAGIAVIAFMFNLIGENNQLKKSEIAQLTREKEELEHKLKEAEFQYTSRFANYTETTAGLNLQMVAVTGGAFTMGCTDEQGSDCYDSEKPAHQVTVSDFYMGKFEVTQKQWREIMGTNPSYFKNCDDCPVEQVNWYDIREFIKKLNQKTGKKYRLPTEAEWEFAARGGASTGSSTATVTKYAGSNNIDEVAWYSSNSGSKTHPVGRKKANELGLYDMSGNVWEWCEDHWHGNYNGAPTNDRAWIDNPRGSSRVLRGGGWGNGARDCRVSFRYDGTPGFRIASSGFRLALAP